MRLLQQPLLRQLRHLIAHRSRAQPRALTALQPRNRPRTHRLARLDIAFNNGRQNSSLPRRDPLRIRHSSLLLNSTPAINHPEFRSIFCRRPFFWLSFRSEAEESAVAYLWPGAPSSARTLRLRWAFAPARTALPPAYEISSTSSLFAAISFAFSATFFAT